MPRHTFGQTLTDWTMDVGTTTTVGSVTTAPVLAKGPAAITFWSAQVGGVQYTDLIDPSGSTTDTITSSDGEDGLTVGAIPEFQGPDNIGEMWADAGAGMRFKMTANDVGGDAAELKSTVADLTATVTALTTMVQNTKGTVVYNAATSSWPERPAGDSRLFEWVGPSAPMAGAPYMEEGDLWVNTSAA